MRDVKRCSVFAVVLALAAVSCGNDDDHDTAAVAEASSGETTIAEAIIAETVVDPTTPDGLDESLLEGVYRTPELTRDQLIAAGVAAGFAEADVIAFVDGDGIERSAVFGLRLAAHGWTQLYAYDGRTEDVGWRGSYEVVDGDTVVATDPCGPITYHYALTGDQLTLDMVDDQCQDGVGELIAQTIIFETASFRLETPSTPSAAGKSSTYSSTSFVLPFDVAVPAWLPAVPSVEQPNFVTWEALAVDRALRFLVPVNVYSPGTTESAETPDDFLAYLLAQREHGADFTDITETTVDGRPATIVTATVNRSLDGSLGCPEKGMTAHDCFGLQPDLILRIAVIDAGDQTLLVWVRDIRGADTTTPEYDSFMTMLASVRFAEQREPTTVTADTAATPIDGTWTTSITEDELASSPLLYDNGEINDENWGRFTFTFEQGRFVETQDNPEATSSGAGKFHVHGDTLTLDRESGEHFVMRWRLEDDTLTLLRVDSLGVAPTPFVIKSWTRQM
jgi:hypothetical protein